MLHVGQNTIANLETFFCILTTSMCNTTCNSLESLGVGSFNTLECAL